TLTVPVHLDIRPLNITRMIADYQRPYIYALQPPLHTGQNGQLLFISSETGNIEKALPIGVNPVDLTINYGEGRLYIASWTESTTYVVDLATQALLPPLHLGPDIYKINAGKPGQLVTEGEDQWVTTSLINTSNSTAVATVRLREGDGEMNPSGRFYYHVDNNISSAGDSGLQKYDLSANTFAPVKSTGGHAYYGSRNLLLSPDGTRIFWTGAAYDSDLNELGYFGQEIYATTAHGDLAFGNQNVFNVHNGQIIYTLPFTTSVLAISGDQKKVFLFDTELKQLRSISMSSIASVPSAGINPNPANASVVNLPLTNLVWTPNPFALTYRVFFGTNESAVAEANTNSSMYLGTTASTAMAINKLSSDQTYYWRVDSIGFSATSTGPVWSFTTAPITIGPQSLAFKAIAGLPILPETISIGGLTGTSWALEIAQPWLSTSITNGIAPSTLALNFDTSGMSAGIYTNQLRFIANGVTLEIPVAVQVFNLNVSKMVADPKRDMIYALHPGAGGIDDSFVAFLNTETAVVEKVLPIGSNATDLAVHPREDRLYVSNWRRSQTRRVDLNTRTELPSLSLGTDVYKINAGLAGRIIVEQEDQWINATLINTTNGAAVATMFVREGDGEPDPTGRYYYHVGNNSSGEQITKYDTGNNSFVPVAGAPKHNGFGSRNLVMSMDGSRLFWTAAMYDAGLFDFGVIGGEIYSCSTNGTIAFTSNQAYDTGTKQVIYTWPVSSTVQVVDRRDSRLWYFNTGNGRIESIFMSEIRSPSITRQPESNTSIGIGGNVFLTVTAAGLGPLKYQWTLTGTNIAAATNSFLSMNTIESSQEGDYQVIVSNSYGAVTSQVAHVTVVIPPTITEQPESTKILAGESFSLSVVALGSAPLIYHWTFEGTPLLSGTNSTLTIANAQSRNEGIYRAIVQNKAGSATSLVANVRVLPSGPKIISQPASVTIGASSNIVFNITAAGSQPLTYQWYFNDSILPGATADHYSLNNVQTRDAGSYHVVVRNSSGSIPSAPAILTVTPVVPYFLQVPESAMLTAGTNLTLVSLARGSEPISYQWQFNGTNIPATNSSLLLTNLALADAGDYRVLASNLAGTSTSIVANVIITAAPPVFVEQPASISLLEGSRTILHSRASGSTPLSYQWFFQNDPIPGQTNPQLILEPVTLASMGSYYVIASNTFGTETSIVARVTVNQPPHFVQNLTNLVVDQGSIVVLAVSATGSDPLSYSWQFNGIPITETNAMLTLTNIGNAQAGYYHVTVSNPYGELSSTGRVSVLHPLSAIQAWGDNSGTQSDVPPGLNDIVAVAGGDFHTLALHHDGSLAAWGFNGNGQLTVPTNSLRFVSIAAGANHSLALLEDGNVVGWGDNTYGQINIPLSVKSVLAIAAGESDSIALLSSGTVIGWGDDTYRQASGSANLTEIKAIAAGRIHNLALRANGRVVGWGYNGYGQTTA
ncbi:MAG: immunoglobulin domain-containing protein, partial [Verrucomicrobiota bacterium]